MPIIKCYFRLCRKLQATEQGLDTLWNSRLMVLNGLFSDNDMEDVRVLRDPVVSKMFLHSDIKVISK